ncbi:flagellar biosynthesis anti-sigma factor FlgM [Desulfofundulus thermosubterraneus]|uniref:Negative regulator of flagellin synthesis n=1 Tax=Desulfofundulus thermosubterraneus DSM 16057 TaxID=1121432 RepID=A0A1M6FYY7_9FIRM|nr:flagellar biosynthesis anti-sigma factor FlgM [Desulfofundulus thermosubterraneus]SHJ02829.1 anti-sigma-28 factor, FlgM family [Desulfofundulus thermosubterraneus DSM 16057]
MRITNNLDPRQVMDVYQKSLKIEESKKNGSPKHFPRADSVEISDRAQELQLYRAHLKKLPEVRDELVESLKKRLAEGTYLVDRERVAAGIMEERRLDRHV